MERIQAGKSATDHNDIQVLGLAAGLSFNHMPLVSAHSEHDPEKHVLGPDRGWVPVSRLREALAWSVHEVEGSAGGGSEKIMLHQQLQ